MNAHSIATLRASFARVEPIAADVGRAFYRRLFASEPGVRALFGADTDAQAVRLIEMIAAGVRLLDRPEALEPALRALGKRHVQYGVEAAHYPIVGRVLLGTLEEVLGEAFTPEVRDAWAGFYGQVAAAMQAGAAAALAHAA